jgi:hypothetical protein
MLFDLTWHGSYQMEKVTLSALALNVFRLAF